MPAHILIIDPLPNRRIHWHARLDTAAFDVSLSDTLSDGLAVAKARAPDVLLIPHDLPGLAMPRLCKTLRANPATQHTSVLVSVPNENLSSRVAALIAGAADVIDQGIASAELHARLRNLMRMHRTSGTADLPAMPASEKGFAEAGPSFHRRTNVVVLFDENATDARARALRLQNETELSLATLPFSEAKRGVERNCDVLVLFDNANPVQALDILGAVRTHKDTRDTPVLFVCASNPAVMPSPLDLGAQDLVSETVLNAEVALRIQRLAKRKREQDATQKAITTLGEIAYVDPLTKLHNRQYAQDYLCKLDRSRMQDPTSMAVLLADVDQFKAVNDTHGHAAGDTILSHIAEVLKGNLRTSDMISRYGGEEFLIVLNEVGLKQARAIAQRLCDHVARTPVKVTSQTIIRSTISLGLAHVPKASALSMNDLIRASDAAMYRAKAAGRNQVSIATTDDLELRPSSKSRPMVRQTG